MTLDESSIMIHKKEATQEATVIAGILNKQATGNGNVIFSKVGGGVFRNVSHWPKSPPIRFFENLGQ